MNPFYGKKIKVEKTPADNMKKMAEYAKIKN